ncbi:MAG: 4'-phosphopantetheinyl transferase superfamily protein [Gammaproteobacteria bacterium]|nr:4'-phosphopantetheinyl transferase superfamily protein [Gammaproteobacteria bacterium]
MARTFISEQARIEYVASRLYVRTLASRYLGVGQREIELRKNLKGKPRLIDPRGARSYRLNISMSHCIKGVAIAFGRKVRVGVDLEMSRQPSAITAAVARSLTGVERNLTTPHQIWDCWARKEALLKGLGLGLSGLDCAPSLESQINVVKSGAVMWTVASLSLGADCSLAYAVEGIRPRIRLFTCRSYTTINRSF